jgi:dipeptidyl aminopeptidase/acylaminoacyl peptidase
VRNIHAPEKSQDRLGATLWQAPQKYIEHSAIFAADRIKTPLLLVTGHEDPNVPERTTMEMYYALRRLGKEVEWVSYTYGGHGMPTTTADLVKDYHTRILAWYDKYLKAPAKKVAAN